MFGEDEEDQIPGNDDKKVTQRVHCLLINSIARPTHPYLGIKAKARTTTPQSSDMIGWLRNTNRVPHAARFFSFDFQNIIVNFKHFKFISNLRFKSHRESTTVNLSFSFLPFSRPEHLVQFTWKIFRPFFAKWTRSNNGKILKLFLKRRFPCFLLFATAKFDQMLNPW